MEQVAAKLRATFIEQVKSRAAAKGLSSNRLADFSGISRSHLSEILSGKASPTLDKIAVIAHALKCEPRDLLAPVDDSE